MIEVIVIASVFVSAGAVICIASYLTPDEKTDEEWADEQW
jgi:hypothetical protein